MDFAVPSLEDLCNPRNRTAFVYAHQDDELPYVGLMCRLKHDADFLWVTNGDGLAPFVHMDPQQYADIRLNECAQVMRILEVPAGRVTNLKHSEIAIYDAFVDWVQFPEKRQQITDFFTGIARQVFNFLQAADPDTVCVPAYQGGHPEHDITAAFAGLSLRCLNRKTGKSYRLIHMPEYEYTILLPFRFKPWYKGPVLRIDLTPQEMAAKQKVMEAYPSQVELMAKFRRVMNGLGKAPALWGRGFTWESYGAVETFGPVPLTFDYGRNLHILDAFNYMGDKNRDVKISFTRMIAPIVASVEARMLTW